MFFEGDDLVKVESKFFLKMGDQNVDIVPLFQGIALHLTGIIKSEGAAAVPSFSGEAKTNSRNKYFQ